MSDVIIPDYSAPCNRILGTYSGYSRIGIRVNRTGIPSILIPEYGQTNAPLVCGRLKTKVLPFCLFHAFVLDLFYLVFFYPAAERYIGQRILWAVYMELTGITRLIKHKLQIFIGQKFKYKITF